MQKLLLVFVIAYMMGAIPFGFVVYGIARGGDIRRRGSGNTGATNVLRSAGPVAGAATLLLDTLKGVAAVAFASHFAPGSQTALGLAALAAVLGHVFSVFLSFHGGKGVATALGAFLAIAPLAVACAAALFAAVAVIWRYVSLASITAAAVFPIILISLGNASRPVIVASALCAALILWRHRSNIQRLRAGTELPAFPGKVRG